MALRKIEALVAENATVVVVAEDPLPRLTALAEDGLLSLERRAYRAGDAGTFALVFAATDDRAVNRRVYEDAEAAGVWANVADDPELCSFHLPARVHRGDLQITVSSRGEAPFVVRRLRQLLERRLGHEWSEWIAAAGRFRRTVKTRRLSRSEEEVRFDRFFAETVDGDALRVRVPRAAETEAWVADGPQPEAPTLRRCDEPRTAAGVGFVSLVGAGPGDPLLLTVRGRRRLRTADAVVYDRLAEPALPCDVPAEAELHCVGKTAGNHPTPQAEINATLVRLAREGKNVVRLKGGDPYVFGRGGEEAEALAEAGVPFEIVPGVTSGIAVPAYAGIPVTHRRESVRLSLLTAHECIKSDGPQVRWELLAADPASTIVGYMGVTALPGVVERLVAAGMDRDTPAAMIERGTTSGQRSVCSTLAGLASAVEEAGLRPPGLFVIGPTVRHAQRLDWFSARPLSGARLLLSAPGGTLGDALELAGAEVVEAPLPLTPAARVAVGALPLTGCIVRSPEEVDLLEEDRGGPGWEADTVCWCVGDAAAEKALALGWPSVERLAEDADVCDVVTRVGRGRAGAAVD